MPELPEVETTGAGVRAALLHQQITEVEVRREGLRLPFPENLHQKLCGQTLEQVSRRAKYLLLYWSAGSVLLIHLGMSGRLIIEPHDDGTRGKHDHLLLHFASGFVLRFNDARRFGVVTHFYSGQEALQPQLQHLGLEPLTDALTPAALNQALKGKKVPIKLALLDQTIIAGLGNIYVCEALHRAGLSPLRPAGAINMAECARLVPQIKAVLAEALAAGGSSLRDYVQTNGTLGYFQTRFLAYDHEGESCSRCADGVILRTNQGGRSSFWCANCQK